MLSTYLYSPIGSALECEASIRRSIHSSGELNYVDRQHALTRWALWTGKLSQDLTSVGQHDLRIKALNEVNTYLPSMRSVSYLAVVKHMHTFKELPE